MKTEWVRVTKQNPCPICKRPDFCCIGEKFINCMRQESPRINTGTLGGWLHPVNADAPAAPVLQLPTKPAPVVDCEALLRSWGTNDEAVRELAAVLGVTYSSLEALGCVYCASRDAYAFPMRDGAGRVVGIRLRNLAGEKWAIKGTHTGIFIPNEADVLPQPTMHICEGPTDTAAALSIGLYAIGRASCSSCVQIIVDTITRLRVRRVVIISDNDEGKEIGGEVRYPGQEGAKALQEKLPVPSVVYLPPMKDLRASVNAGLTAELLNAMVRDLLWAPGHLTTDQPRTAQRVSPQQRNA